MQENQMTTKHPLHKIETHSTHNKGSLKIFLGYATGVGKTYSMLEAAHSKRKDGVDVAVGYVESQSRAETDALLVGLEQIKVLDIVHNKLHQTELNLDAALKRHPQLIIVDKMEHTNADECKYKKRYQEIEELLRNGIDVYTTLNIQSMKGLHDIVASITDIQDREKIPDYIFEQADQVELVDIEPEELLLRYKQGKIFCGQEGEQAFLHYFRVENLAILREIAFRKIADRLKKDSEKGERRFEHILICLSSASSNIKVIRTAANMAYVYHASLTALFVETSNYQRTSVEEKARLKEHMYLAERLGANISSVYGDDVAVQIAEYASASGVSKIVVGRSNTKRRGWGKIIPSLADKLLDIVPNIDIYIISDKISMKKKKRPIFRFDDITQLSFGNTMKALGVLFCCTVIGFFFQSLGFSEANIITVYILGILLVAMITTMKLYGIVSSIVSVILFNFLFIEPRFSLNSDDAEYPITFFIMLLASFITSNLTTRVKIQAKQAADKAFRMGVLFETSRKLQRAETRQEIIQEIANQMIKMLSKTIVFYPSLSDKLGEPIVFKRPHEKTEVSFYTCSDEKKTAAWVLKNNKHAGATTQNMADARGVYLPVRGKKTFAVVGIMLDGEGLEPFVNSLLVSMLSECALALEKEELYETKKETEIRAEQEKLRANLLRSISHDLRTPLTSISGNAGVLMTNANSLEENKKYRLYSDIYDDAIWLISLVENLLAITRIEDENIHIHIEAELVEEVIAEALNHINHRKIEHHIKVILRDDLMMARMDARLIVQVFINIIDNAIKYTPKGSTIKISARKEGGNIVVEISDDGKGISNKEHIFDMFYTENNSVADSRRGLGLGLALCKSIIQLHGGTIIIKDNKPHGAIFSFTLQAEEVSLHE